MTDGSALSIAYPCTCGTAVCATDAFCTAAKNKCKEPRTQIEKRLVLLSHMFAALASHKLGSAVGLLFLFLVCVLCADPVFSS